MVAFGTHGGLSKIELVSVADGGSKLTTISAVNVGMSSALTHLDWSADSQAVVVNSQAYELMWLNVNAKQRINASGSKDIEWATWTCVLGFPVQGIWPGPDFTDVNSTCRSNSRTVLATADDFGKVKLFKYPCVIEHASSKEHMGHSSHVTKVKFSAGDNYVVSTGGNDKTVLIWETDFGMDNPASQIQPEEEMEEPIAAGNPDDDFEEPKIDMAKIEKQKRKEEEKKSKPKAAAPSDPDDPFQMEDVGEGDEFMAVKPWMGQMKEPSDFRKPPKNQNVEPAITMDLQWVHGYRARDCKNNIAYLKDGNIAWNAAGLGVVYDPTEHSQKFFKEHIDDVTAIAFSPDQQHIATGEVGPKPTIYVWDALTMQVKHALKGKLTKGIQAIAFSPSGNVLAAVAIDDNHYVAAYNVQTGACLGCDKGDTAFIIELAFKDDTQFASAGVKHYKFWTIGANLTAKRGQFGKYSSMVGSCAYNQGSFLTGSKEGELYIWSDTSIKSSKKLHERPIDAISITPSAVLTGGRDGLINILNPSTYAKVSSFSLTEAKFQDIVISPVVRALCLNDKTNNLLIGTFSSDILEVPIKPSVGAPKVIVQGHYAPCKKDNNEIWGLAPFPNKALYVTVSDDATLRVWDTAARKQVKCVKLNLDREGKEMPLDP